MKTMFRLGLLALGLSLAAPAATAQDAETQDLRDKYAKKLEKEFVGKIDWAQSFEQASATAKKDGKLVLGYFTRSYAP